MPTYAAEISLAEIFGPARDADKSAAKTYRTFTCACGYRFNASVRGTCPSCGGIDWTYSVVKSNPKREEVT